MAVADLLSVLPEAIAVTVGADHVVESVSRRGGQLFGTALRPGHPIRRTLPAGELIAALDTAYRSGGTTVVPRGVLSSMAGGPPGGMEFGVSCAPVGDGSRGICGLLLRVLADGPDDDGRSGLRERQFQRLAEQLSSAATPADIGRLTATTAAALIGADASAVYARAEGADAMELLHHAG